MRVASTMSPGQRAVEAVRYALPGGVETEVEPAADDRRVDLVVNGHEIEVKWIGDGRLSDARRVVAVLGRHEHVIAVARHMSPGARELLAAHRIGWADETGAAEIVIGSIVVSRSGQPSSQADAPPRWTRSVVAVAEALLCDTQATVAAVSDATGLSTGSSTNALRTLTDLGLLEQDSDRGPTSGRRVADPDALLAAYTTAVHALPPPPELTVGALWRDPIDGLADLGHRWDQENVRWVVSGSVASMVLAPVLTTVDTALVYIGTATIAGLDAAARAVDLKPIDRGRLTLRALPTRTTLRFASTSGEVPCAPWPRVYADLLHSGVRGEEAAEHLRELMIDGR